MTGGGRLLVRGGHAVLRQGLAQVDVLCERGRIAALGRDLPADGARVLIATGFVVGPGFVDVHVHGGGGHSFFEPDPEGVRAYARWAPARGVTSFLVSTVGRDHADTETLLTALRPAIGAPGAEPLGFHLEGPFINPVRKGAFPPRMLHPVDVDAFRRFQEAAGGMVRQVTLAPELPGALALIDAVVASGAVASMGHTDATAAEARAGFERGVTHVTHLFNAMRPLHQREGGPIAAALLDGRVTCELICDGAHVAKEVLSLAFGLLGRERAVVVTDNLAIAGTGTTETRFAGGDVRASGAAAVRDDGTIVGSVATLDIHFRRAARLFGGVEAAFDACARNPARVAGASDRKAEIASGMDADLVVLDRDLGVVAAVCRGEVAFERGS